MPEKTKLMYYSDRFAKIIDDLMISAIMTVLVWVREGSLNTKIDLNLEV